MRHHHHHRSSIRIGGDTAAIVNIVVMLCVGLLLLGLGLGFVGIAVAVPILRNSFLLTGGILAPTGLAMFGGGIFMGVRRANTKRLEASGVPGQAQIVSLTPTSFYLDGQRMVELQLRVTTATHAPYAVSRRETVPSFVLARLTTGQILQVKVDPARPNNLLILWESR